MSVETELITEAENVSRLPAIAQSTVGEDSSEDDVVLVLAAGTTDVVRTMNNDVPQSVQRVIEFHVYRSGYNVGGDNLTAIERAAADAIAIVDRISGYTSALISDVYLQSSHDGGADPGHPEIAHRVVAFLVRATEYN